MNAHLSSEAMDLNVRWSLFLLPYSMYMVSEGSGDTVRMFARAISTKISCTSLSKNIYVCKCVISHYCICIDNVNNYTYIYNYIFI